jgi:hypothetical protein
VPRKEKNLALRDRLPENAHPPQHIAVLRGVTAGGACRAPPVRRAWVVQVVDGLVVAVA